jgi:hypothetical protein
VTFADTDFKGTSRFMIRRRLGSGGMGVVYEAFDEDRQSVVALKTLLRMDPQNLYRFKNEFRALADLDHPNLVRLYELFSEGGRWFFTMELIEGLTFLEFAAGIPHQASEPDDDTLVGAPRRPSAITRPMMPRPRFDERKLRNALAQLASGLAALHAAGKVHRDVKPSNILVTPAGRLVLLDFGLVTPMTRKEETATDQQVVGTALYMAPEQAASSQVGPEADWYSLGCLLYQALTGITPFDGAPIDVLMDKQRYEPPPPRQHAPSVPSDLDALCVELLRFDPRARPREAQILARLGVRDTAPAVANEAAARTLSVPFVGREPELAELHAAFEVSRGGQPVTVIVQGESGLGKTALARHFIEDLQRGDPHLLALAGRCYERESLPFKAFDGIVDQLSHHLARIDQVRAALLLPDDAALLARVFPVLRRIPAMGQVREPARDVQDPQQLRTRAFAALRKLLAKLIEDRPLLLFIDDLQWADADSLVLLRDLVHPRDAPPLFLLATARPMQLPLELGERREIALKGLPPENATELATLLGGAADAPAIAREAGGHPLFIQELVRYAGMTGDRPRGEVRLDEALAARIDRLDPPARKLLDLVCVAGGPIGQAVAAQAIGLEFAECAKMLSLLRSAYLARTSGLRDTDIVEPYHDRVREAVMGALAENAKRQHHAALATALEASGAAAQDPRTLVRHLEAAGETERAADQAERAARLATEAFGFDRASELYRIALRLGRYEPAQKRTLLAAFADALANAGRSPEAAEAFLEAAEGADAATRLDCRRRAMEQFLISGHVERGVGTLGQVLGEIGVRMPHTPRTALVSLLWQRFKLRLRGLGWTPRDATQVAASELTRLEIFRAAGHGLAIVDNVRASDFNTRALLLALRLGEPSRALITMATEASFISTGGRKMRKQVQKITDETARIAARYPGPLSEAWVISTRGITNYLQGHFADAKAQLRQGEALLRNRTWNRWELSSARLLLCFALRQSGMLRELSQCFDEYAHDAARRGDHYLGTTLSRSFGIVWLAQDEVTAALRDLDQRTWAPPQGGYHLQHYYEMRARAEIDLYQGKTDTLERVRADFDALARSLNARIQIVRADARWLHGRLALAAGQPAIADQMARRLEREKVPYALVWAHLLRAAVASQSGSDPSEHLRAAISLGDAEEVLLCAAAARRRLGDPAGDAWMTAEGIKNPDRMTDVIAPGFGKI